eukprot:182647-Chlamydomonas_euryale.AAC.2
MGGCCMDGYMDGWTECMEWMGWMDGMDGGVDGVDASRVDASGGECGLIVAIASKLEATWHSQTRGNGAALDHKSSHATLSSWEQSSQA